MANGSSGDYPRRPKLFACLHCSECKNNMDPSRLLPFLEGDTVVDISNEMTAIDENEKGQFEAGENPEIPDNRMYTAREKFMWKFQNQKKNEQNNNSGSNNDGPE